VSNKLYLILYKETRGILSHPNSFAFVLILNFILAYIITEIRRAPASMGKQDDILNIIRFVDKAACLTSSVELVVIKCLPEHDATLR
jgi:hypothetical protein